MNTITERVNNNYLIQIKRTTQHRLYSNDGIPDVGFQPLTNREFQIIELVARDYSDKEIAKYLHLSVRTISNNIIKICEKLKSKSRTGAVVNAIAIGIITPHIISDIRK